VGTSWVIVTLPYIYESPVVVASPQYDLTGQPVVARIRNVSDNSFELRVQNPSGLGPYTGVPVHIMVVEEGKYSFETHGVKMEAVTFTSSVTDHNSSWVGEERTYQMPYTNPVLVGQVMSYNDADWSVFWARGATYDAPPSSSELWVGKHVGEDSDITRADETIGYVVFEAGARTADGVEFIAGVGPDIVAGVSDSPPYGYYITGLETTTAAIVSQSGMDGSDGSWPILYGTSAVQQHSLDLAVDEDLLSDPERNHSTEQVSYVVFGTPYAPADDPYLQRGVVSGVDNQGWTRVQFGRSYNSMVVIPSANYDASDVPLVVRIDNAEGDHFDIRVDRADASTGAITGIDIHYMVVEEGVYNEVEHGVKMEAVKFTSSVTDEDDSWIGEARSYANAYTNPVVLGQVMSYKDLNWSTFWSRGSTAADPPSPDPPPSGVLYVGKNVGEDPVPERAAETIGYIVIEAGSGTMSGVDYVAAVGPDEVWGVDDDPPYSYPISGLATASAGIVSQTAMDGGNGGWAILYGSNPVSYDSLNLAIDEDRLMDPERNHTSEQVAYIVFE
jgi:hypothetical protein